MNQMNYTATPGAPVPAYAKGCLGAAWDDIKATPGYVGKLVVLGLIMCVPILNFVVMGYLLHWSREVPFGGRTPLPQKYVTGKNFEFGFYAFVISLVVGLVVGVVGTILMFVPILGQLANVVLMLAAAVAIYLLQMRMIMGLTFGDGFKVSEAWEAAKRNWGELFLVTLVPTVIAGAIVSVLCTIVVVIMLFTYLGGAMPTLMAAGSADHLSASGALGLVGMLLGVGSIAFLIVYVVGTIISTVAQVITVRAMGHWVARYVPEWTAAAVAVPPMAPAAGAMPTMPMTPMTPTAGAVPPTGAPVPPAPQTPVVPQEPVVPQTPTESQAPAAPAEQAPAVPVEPADAEITDNPQEPSAQ